MGRVRSKRDVDVALRKKGFRRNDNGTHIRYCLVGLPRIRTMLSHGAMSETLSAKLIGDMSRQLQLTKSQFLALIDCTLDEEGYRDILKPSR